MPRFPLWAILTLLLIAPAGIGQERNAPRGSWMPRWLSGLRSPAPKAAPLPAPSTGGAASTPTAPQSAEVIRRLEQANWSRRVKVCDKLREIAMETGDEELMRKADWLDQRAWEYYRQKTGQLPMMQMPAALQDDLIGSYLEKQQASGDPDFRIPQNERRVRANGEEQP